LGKQEGNVKTEVQRLTLRHDDCLLLCTDGLTEMVDDQRIAETLALETSTANACQRLIDLALEAGGRDNITAVVARYRFPDAAPSA
jgi:protein phosphatase